MAIFLMEIKNSSAKGAKEREENQNKSAAKETRVSSPVLFCLGFAFLRVLRG